MPQLLVRAPWQIYLIPPFMAAANGLTMANMGSLVSKTAGPELQGMVLGMNASVLSLANAIPPLLSGLIAAELSPTAPVAVGAFVCLTGWMAFGLATRAAAQA